MNNDIAELNQQNSCGIKKIIDCKVENGQQMYKVKWEPTWEPAENLVTCQHLIDEFWSYVNHLKIGEKIAQQHRNQTHLKPNNRPNSDCNLYSLTDDNKYEIQKLISRSSQSEVGTLISPSNAFQSTLSNTQNSMQSNSFNNTNNSAQSKTPVKSEPLIASNPSNNNNKIGASGLKYIENFDNPYVKIVVVCKVCSKEQSLKHVHAWKLHYLTHSDKKTHPCPHCPKGFLRADRLRNHIQKYHANSTPQQNMEPKQEQQEMYFKNENY